MRRCKEPLTGTVPVVLIVDDDEAIQHLLKEALEEGGFATRVTSFGEEAIGLLNRKEASCALIIDISFGSDHVKGWSVARRARALNPDLPPTYITGGSSNDWSVHGAPKSVLLNKPFAAAPLLTALSQLLNVG